VGITGISMHSYRYNWAERAKSVGMPERFAQQALGHSSKAFARAYSEKGEGDRSLTRRIQKENRADARGGESIIRELSPPPRILSKRFESVIIFSQRCAR
jgi:hypothetical protein